MHCIKTLCSLYVDLSERYTLTGKGYFWEYLKMRGCLTQRTQYRDGNPLTDFFKMPTDFLLLSSIAGLMYYLIVGLRV